MTKNICGYCNTTQIALGESFCEDCKQFMENGLSYEPGLKDYLLNIDTYNTPPEISIIKHGRQYGGIKIYET